MSFCGYGQQVKIICDVPGDGGGWGRERVLGAEALQDAPASLSTLGFPFHGQGGSPCRGVSAVGSSVGTQISCSPRASGPKSVSEAFCLVYTSPCSSSTGRALRGAGLTLKPQGMGAGDGTRLQAALV